MTLTVSRRAAITIGVASVAGVLAGLWVSHIVVARWSPSSGMGIHAQVATLYKALPSTAHSVMLGDSLTHWGLRAEPLPSKSVLSRGIAGNRITSVRDKTWGSVMLQRPLGLIEKQAVILFPFQ
jgi:hypothetical protein